jgi:hypothetical protein
MRARSVTLVAVAAAVAVIAAVIIRFGPSGSGPAAANAPLPTAPASYLGVYEHGPPGYYQQVEKFTKSVGQQPNLVGYYSGWGEGFQASFARTVDAHGAVTIVQWDPTGASVARIAAGDYDSYLRVFADSVRAFGRPVVIGFGHEMNATWYTWGYGRVRPRTFVTAWRHIVRLFRSRGADNVTWLWTINADLPSTGRITDWWPGAGYVTWVGIDGYYYRPSDTFGTVFGPTITQARELTHKPVLLSETAVGPVPGQPAKIGNLFAGMRLYQTLGLVWFDISQDDGIYHQDWRIENSRAAEAAFQRGVARMTLMRP